MKPLTLALASIVLLPATAMAGRLEAYFNTLEGLWGRNGCTQYKHKIKVSQNKEFLEFESEDGSYYYYFVAGPERKGLKVVLMHEDRFDDKGNLVYWYIVMDGKNRFYWLRSDRREDDLRGPIDRCKYKAPGTD